MGEQTIRILKEGDEPALSAFLIPRLESSMFLFGNMRSVGLVDEGERYQGTYAASFDGEEITGVVAHYWNENLILQASEELLALILAAAGNSGRPVAGLIGPNDQVQEAINLLGWQDKDLRHDEVEGLYYLQLDKLEIPDILSSKQVLGRRVTEDDVDLVAEWRAGFLIESLGEKDSPQLRRQCLLIARHAVHAGQTWILESAGTPVATSSFNIAIEDVGGIGIVQIGGVWTPPRYRRRGYARAVVAASLLESQAESIQRAILFTGESNIPARKAYAALGFQRIGDYRLTFRHQPLPALD